MADYPALPLWTDAYLADCGHLSDAEHGRYLRLLMEMWRTPHCRLPDDDQWLARKFNRTAEQVESELRPLLREFFSSDGNWLVQKRLRREFEYVSRTSRSQSARAKSRWRKQKKACPADAGSMPARTARKARARPIPASPGTTTTKGDAPTPTPTPKSLSRSREREGPARSVNGGQHGDQRQRLPESWRPSTAQIDFARELGLDPEAIAEAFVLYWTEGKGRREQRSAHGWDVTWRSWCRRDAERLGGTASSHGPSNRPARGGGLVGAALRLRARHRDP